MKKENILKNNYDFQRIIKNNKPYKYKDYIIFIEYNNDDNFHFGFSVGKKIGNAVIRNKIKRQLKCILGKKKFKKGFNCIIIVGRSILLKDFSKREENLLDILLKINIIKGDKDE